MSQNFQSNQSVQNQPSLFEDLITILTVGTVAGLGYGVASGKLFANEMSFGDKPSKRTNRKVRTPKPSSAPETSVDSAVATAESIITPAPAANPDLVSEAVPISEPVISGHTAQTILEETAPPITTAQERVSPSNILSGDTASTHLSGHKNNWAIKQEIGKKKAGRKKAERAAMAEQLKGEKIARADAALDTVTAGKVLNVVDQAAPKLTNLLGDIGALISRL